MNSTSKTYLEGLPSKAKRKSTGQILPSNGGTLQTDQTGRVGGRSSFNRALDKPNNTNQRKDH